MAMGRHRKKRQEAFWIATDDVVRSAGHPFYRKLNELLEQAGFDRFVESLCEPYYHASLGRPGLAPGVYFRMLLMGFFEGIDSERGIDWECSDRLCLREFIGYPVTQATPDHSTLCTTRQRLPLEVHAEVFAWVLAELAARGLLQGKTLGVDATTLEANAAMRSIVRRDTGASYQEFLVQLARASGIETPTREDLAKLDRKRKNKASNEDWTHPHDPDAKITKMKDGRTHLAHKAEHAVDMDTGAIVAVTVQPADAGDTTTLWTTLEEAQENLRQTAAEEDNPDDGSLLKEVVADKGYHSNDVTTDLTELGIRSYISEPDRGRRNWQGKAAARAAVYGNRRRIRGKRGRKLMRGRGQKVERTFAHCYETGGMRRTHLRGHDKILKRLLIHTAGFNLALIMRALFGMGKPRCAQDGLGKLLRACFGLLWPLCELLEALQRALTPLWRKTAVCRAPNGPAAAA